MADACHIDDMPSPEALKHFVLWDPLILKARSGVPMAIAPEEGT